MEGIHIISYPDILIGTLPETSSSHLKIGRTCQKDTSIPYSNGIHFQVLCLLVYRRIFCLLKQTHCNCEVPTERRHMVRCAVGIFVVRKMPGLYPSRPGTWLTLPKGHPPPNMERWSRVYYQIIDYQFIISSIISFEFLIKGAENLYLKSPIFECSKNDIVAISETSGLLWVFHCLWPRNAWVWPWEQQVRCFGVLGGDKMDFEVARSIQEYIDSEIVNMGIL